MNPVPWVSLAGAAFMALTLTLCLRGPKMPGPSVWEIQADLPHRAPPAPFTLTEAVDASHVHRHCLPQDCPRRCAALRVLHEHDRITLSEAQYRVVYGPTDTA